jgi:hypothetical protein
LGERDLRQRRRLAPPARFRRASSFRLIFASLAVLAWAIFLSYRFAVDACHTGLANSLFGQGRFLPVLAIILSASGAAAGLGLVAYAVTRNAAAFRLLTAAALVSGRIVGAFLTLSSNSGAAVLTFVFLAGWSLSVGDGLVRRLKVESGLFTGGARLSLAIGLGIGVLSFSVFGLSLAGVVGDAGLS